MRTAHWERNRFKFDSSKINLDFRRLIELYAFRFCLLQSVWNQNIGMVSLTVFRYLWDEAETSCCAGANLMSISCITTTTNATQI